MPGDQLYHMANIRELLTKGFDDAELRELCLDVLDFRPVFDRLARGMRKDEMVGQLLEYALRKMQIDTLLALAQQRNPARYEEHGPYYVTDPTPALQKQVTDLAKQLTAPTALTREQQYQIALRWVELGRRDSLRRFDLSGSDLRGVELCGANLRAANLSGAKLSPAILNRADLEGADLRRADLEEANLRAANLSAAHLYRANLREADLRGANLEGTDLTRAYLEAADLSGRNVPSPLCGARSGSI